MSATTHTVTAGRGKDRLDPALVKLIVIMLAGVAPSLLDTSIVNVAVDAIGRDLHTTVASIQWVITGYLLSFGMVIPLSGWALARFGGRASWLFALSLFMAGSAASGAAWSAASLIGFRVLQGIGGGLMLPLLTTLLTQAAGGQKLGRLMASVSLPVAVIPVLGPVISGLIITNLSWRWIFYVNVPVCLTGLALAWRGLPADRPRAPRAAKGTPALTRARPAQSRGTPLARLDIPGLLLLCPALAALLYGLAQAGSSADFGQPEVVVPVAAGLALLVTFVVYALHTSREPLVNVRLFRARSFAGACWLLFLAGLSIYGAMLLLPLYFQQARGYSPLDAGLLLVPQGVGSILPRTIVGKLTDRIGPRPVTLAGVTLATLGTIPFALAGGRTSLVLLSAALVVRGAGLGAATIAVMAGAFDGLDRADLPHASSATRIMQQVGGAFGAAVLVVILARQAADHPVVSAFGDTFWWCLSFTALAVWPALLLPGRLLPGAGQRSGRAARSSGCVRAADRGKAINTP